VNITLQLWDLGGEERFRIFFPAYARGSFGGIFIYDITRYNSLRNLDEWLNIFERGTRSESHKVPILMVGTKLDLEEVRSVTREDALDRSQNHEIYDLIECSSKTGYNVEKIFESITLKIIDSMGLK
jgi:small GTP-binding protein